MRNIAVFTGNRADESPMTPVLKAIEGRDDLRAYPTGPGFEHDIPVNDVLLVLGDRHELLPVCHQAILHRKLIAHIHGGETTRGAFDDKIRHAVSQLADIHFTAAPQFTEKLVLMGIDPKTIFTVGAPSLDDLETDPVCEFGEGFFLVTLHPETAGGADNNAMRSALVEALERFPDRAVVITDTNNDPGHEGIRSGLIAFAAATLRNYARAPVKFVRTLGRRRYLTAMKHAAVVIGNSSSGIIEAPALGTPAVNVGNRQKGRPLADAIFCPAEVHADFIADMIQLALADQVKELAMLGVAGKRPLPYGAGGASKKIAEVLATWAA